MTNKMTFDEWVGKYRPVVEHGQDGQGQVRYFETYGEDVEEMRAKYQPNQIWTMIDGEGVSAPIIAGIHWVNRLNYLVTEVPWESTDIEVEH